MPATVCEPRARIGPPRSTTGRPAQVPEPDPDRAAEPGRWDATAALVVRAQAGDREAFGLLAEQFGRTVHAIGLRRLGNPWEAAELTQEVFLHALTRIGQLREPERFAGWLRQMVVRMAINRATRRVPPPSIEDELLDAASGVRDEPVESLIARERADGLRTGLARLKDLDREALDAFYIQGQPLAEIADRLGVPLGTVKRRLHTARRRLKTLLLSESDGPGDWVDAPFEDQNAEPESALALA